MPEVISSAVVDKLLIFAEDTLKFSYSIGGSLVCKVAKSTPSKNGWAFSFLNEYSESGGPAPSLAFGSNLRILSIRSLATGGNSYS